MFKQITAAVLLLAFITGNFSKQLIMADYYMNRAAYAKNCINKSRPMLHCNGHCQMMKKIREEEKKDAENSDRIESMKNQVISSRSFFPVIGELSFTINHISFPRICDNSGLRSMPRSCFHPPSLIS